jgi:hypothetical protein
MSDYLANRFPVPDRTDHPKHKHSSTQALKHPSTPVLKYSSTPILQYSNPPNRPIIQNLYE